MRSIITKNYTLNKNIDLTFSKKYNLLILKNVIGIMMFFLPSYHFFKNIDDQISFIFLKKFFFKSFISHFFTNYLNLNYIYIVRLKIKGLGYQIYKILIVYTLFIFISLIIFMHLCHLILLYIDLKKEYIN